MRLKRALWILSFIALPVLSVFTAFRPSSASSVSGTAYWIWAGRSVTEISGEISPDATLYIHQATLERRHAGHLHPLLRRQGVGVVSLPGHPLFLTYRIEVLDNAEALATQFLSDKLMWESRENFVKGIQIDFDSPSLRLDAYIDFLERVRSAVGEKILLSVTGLADWAASSEPRQIARLFRTADEVVFQLYNGRNAIPNLDHFQRSLLNISHPFKIGILPEEKNQILSEILSSKNYRGDVIFK